MSIRLTVSLAIMAFTGATLESQDEFVGVGLRLNTRASVYVRSESAQVFVGEPLELTVTVINNTKASINLGNEARHWSEQLNIAVQPEDRVVVVPMDGAKPSRQVLAAGRSTAAVVRLRGRRNEGIGVGQYRVAVRANPATFNRQGRRPDGRPFFNVTLDQILDFEVKAPSTLEERIDHALHLAYHAKRAGDMKNEEAQLREVLRLNPVSAVGFADLGHLYLRIGNCSQARELFGRAVNILGTGADTLLTIGRVDQEDWASVLSSASAGCTEQR